MEPVPQNWQILQQPNDDIIYYNVVTKQRTTQHPMDESYRNLYLQERAKLKLKLENSPEPKSNAILIEDSS